MNEANSTCPNCGKQLPRDAVLGLCAPCLVKSGFETEAGENAAGSLEAIPAIPEIAKLFPQLEMLAFIGKGGMSAVYKARQPALDRAIALKILPPKIGADPGFAERFNREGRTLARLNHPNIVSVYDFGQSGGFYYLTMEFVDGINLRDILRRGKLDPRQALELVPQICDALQYAHDEGVVHRDIKPENILLDTKGRIKIADFGIAKIATALPMVGLTNANDVVGTPHYMAPEQIESPALVDHRADIYSLGVVLYELLTGELPLGRFSPPSAKARVDSRVDDLVLRTLEKNPDDRYQRVAEVKSDTQHIVNTPPVICGPDRKKLPETVKGVSKKGFVVASIGGLAVVIVVLGMDLILRKRSADNAKAIPASAGSAPKPTARPGQTLDGGEPSHPLGSDNSVNAVELTDPKLQQALIDLGSSNETTKELAASLLAGAEPTEPKRDEVARALITVLKDDRWPVRQRVAKALGVWRTNEAFDPLVQTLDDPEFSVRWAAIASLALWKNAKAADMIARHLAKGMDYRESSRALQAIGPESENATDGLLTAADARARAEACRVLKEIGTAKSLPTLSTVAARRGTEARLAKEAAVAIQSRL